MEGGGGGGGVSGSRQVFYRVEEMGRERGYGQYGDVQ